MTISLPATSDFTSKQARSTRWKPPVFALVLWSPYTTKNGRLSRGGVAYHIYICIGMDIHMHAAYTYYVHTGQRVTHPAGFHAVNGVWQAAEPSNRFTFEGLSLSLVGRRLKWITSPAQEKQIPTVWWSRIAWKIRESHLIALYFGQCQVTWLQCFETWWEWASQTFATWNTL